MNDKDLAEFVNDCSKDLQNALLAALQQSRQNKTRLSVLHIVLCIVRTMRGYPQINPQLNPQTIPSYPTPASLTNLEPFLDNSLQANKSEQDPNKPYGHVCLADLVLQSRKIQQNLQERTQAKAAPKIDCRVFLAACLQLGAKAEQSNGGWARCLPELSKYGIELDPLLQYIQKTPPELSPISSAHPQENCVFEKLGFGIDLTKKAQSWTSCPLIGMDKELRRLVVELTATSNSAVLVGPPGVGKSALVEGLAYHIAKRTRPLIPEGVDGLDHYRIISFSSLDFLAQTSTRGSLEEKLQEFLKCFHEFPHIIAFFDELHTLLDTTEASTRTVANAFKPAMANGQFRCLGATTDAEYARFIASDNALNSRFIRILLEEPTPATTKQILRGVIPQLLSDKPRFSSISFSDDALQSIVQLTEQYQRNDHFPRKAIRLARGVISEKRYRCQTNSEESPLISSQDVAQVLSEQTNIPFEDLDPSRKDVLLRMRQRLNQQVRGQTQAIESTVSWLAMHLHGWTDRTRPKGRFLFLGPPGVGKSALARALAAEVQKDRGAVIEKNMADFKGEGSRTRFMGADPGYVGFRETHTLYNQVMMRPYSVVILDEFEKAHPELGQNLLAIFDGSAEDAQGRRVDFSQCIFVMTSNAITNIQPEMAEDALRNLLLRQGGIWQAPLLDRIDRVAFFQPLSSEVLETILAEMVRQRQASCSLPLPTQLFEDQELQQRLIHRADGSLLSSARELERNLNQWLIRHLETASTTHVSTEEPTTTTQGEHP